MQRPNCLCCSQHDSQLCRSKLEHGEEGGEGPVAAWWEEWDKQDGPTRKRKHPTSKPTPEEAQEDHGLTSMTVEVRSAARLAASV